MSPRSWPILLTFGITVSCVCLWLASKDLLSGLLVSPVAVSAIFLAGAMYRQRLIDRSSRARFAGMRLKGDNGVDAEA